MTNLKFVGAAAVLSAALLGPAMANQPVQARHNGMSTYCATIEPGNPYGDALKMAKPPLGVGSAAALLGTVTT